MLFTLFGVCFEFWITRIRLPQYQLKGVDYGLGVLIWIITQWGTPVIGDWMMILVLLLLGYSIYTRARDWRAAVVVSIESLLIVTIVTQLTQLIAPLIAIADAIPLTFFLFSLVIGGLLHWSTRQSILPTGQINTMMAGLVSLAFLLIIAYLKFISGNQPTPTMTLVGLGLVLILCVILLVGQREHQRLLKKQALIALQQQTLTSNQRYTRAMEQHYDELRRFRHDYQNVMLSLSEYLATDDLAGLKHYYQTNLVAKTAQLKASKYELEDLAKVPDKAIKSILFNKLNSAQQSGVTVRFESQQVAQLTAVPSVDLAVMLGIILDNAVEATVNQSEGWVHVVMIAVPTAQTILVKNSLAAKVPALWQLERSGFSTKGSDRGLGLTNLKSMLAIYPQVELATTITEQCFSQQLTIRLDGQS